MNRSLQWMSTGGVLTYPSIDRGTHNLTAYTCFSAQDLAKVRALTLGEVCISLDQVCRHVLNSVMRGLQTMINKGYVLIVAQTQHCLNACSVSRCSSRWGEGAAEACLLSHTQFSSTADQLQQGSSSAFQTLNDDESSASLNESCINALFDLKVQQGEDIRFNHALASACTMDKTLFCRDIQPSRGGVVPCLTSHSSEPGFSSECGAD